MQLGYIHICRGTNFFHRGSLMCKHWTQKIQVYPPRLATSHWGRLYRPSLGHRLQNLSCELKKAWLYTTGITQPRALAQAAAAPSAKNQFPQPWIWLPRPHPLTATPYCIRHQWTPLPVGRVTGRTGPCGCLWLRSSMGQTKVRFLKQSESSTPGSL